MEAAENACASAAKGDRCGMSGDGPRSVWVAASTVTLLAADKYNSAGCFWKQFVHRAKTTVFLAEWPLLRPGNHRLRLKLDRSPGSLKSAPSQQSGPATPSPEPILGASLRPRSTDGPGRYSRRFPDIKPTTAYRWNDVRQLFSPWRIQSAQVNRGWKEILGAPLRQSSGKRPMSRQRHSRNRIFHLKRLR